MATIAVTIVALGLLYLLLELGVRVLMSAYLWWKYLVSYIKPVDDENPDDGVLRHITPEMMENSAEQLQLTPRVAGIAREIIEGAQRTKAAEQAADFRRAAWESQCWLWKSIFILSFFGSLVYLAVR
jgi:hypothetical protein